MSLPRFLPMVASVLADEIDDGLFDGVGKGLPGLYQPGQIGIILTVIVFDCAGFCARVL
ncbi:MAG: hypothetical protein IIA65_05055 [Planctomycetes bacterium]|nr:hypothetical protein [Planctomycetota bacterium]